MVKNLDEQSKTLTSKLQDVTSPKVINSVLYSDPFLKTAFMARLVSESENPVLYVDFDLLYSGYVVSGSIVRQENLTLFQPTKETIEGVLRDVAVRASVSKVLIIIDSINGFYNLLNEKKQAGRMITSIMMLISSISRQTDSYLVMASMARYKMEEGWVLSPTGKRLIATRHGKKILLEYGTGGITVNPLDGPGKFLIPNASLHL